MPSDYNRRITEHERDCMDVSILQYLTRHVVSYGECPHYEALRDLHLASLPHIIRPAWYAMRDWYTAMQRRPQALDQSATAAAPVRLPSGHVLLMQHTALKANELFEPILGISDTQLFMVEAADLGMDKAKELEAWATQACQIAARVHRSFQIATEITALASTVGQLHRMCPDLVKYVFPQTAEALKNQQRRSPIPDEWMQVDRARVADMVNHLALCYLLSDTDYRTRDYRTVLDGWCWAFDRTTFGFAGYASTRGWDKDKLSMCSPEGDWIDP